jgi:hypothetical protein
LLEHANTAKTALVSKFVAKTGQAGPMAEAVCSGRRARVLPLFGTATTADVIDYA